MNAPQRPFSTRPGRSASDRQRWQGVEEATSTGAEAAQIARRGTFVTRHPGLFERLSVVGHQLNEHLKKYGLNL